jgi:hypothetical protein
METFVGCQRGKAASAIDEECRVVAYESCGRASSSAAANPIKPEPSDEACDPRAGFGSCRMRPNGIGRIPIDTICTPHVQYPPQQSAAPGISHAVPRNAAPGPYAPGPDAPPHQGTAPGSLRGYAPIPGVIQPSFHAMPRYPAQYAYSDRPSPVPSSTHHQLQIPVSVYRQSTGNNGEDGNRAEPEIRRGPTGLDPHTEDRALPEEADGMDGGAASRKRGAPPTSDGSGRKQAKCEHGRRKDQCRECGGSGVCPHGRIKHTCTDCGGSGICPHGRRKSECKDCGGSRICTHGKRQSRCKECGGSEICPHGREKRTCKECGGSDICPHGREKRRCKECGGSAICPHGREKRMCRECGGSAICPHGRRKLECRECGGSAICPHGRIKYTCKDCLLMRRSTTAAQASLAVCSSSGDTADRGDALDRDAPLDELRAWVGGLERIGDAEQVVALLVESEVSLANLGSFTVDELAATGIGEAAACELLFQFECRGMRRQHGSS